MDAIDRLPPHSIEAEEAVLGSLLIDPDAIFDVAAFLKPESFYRERNRWIYEAIRDLYERHDPVDLVTLVQELHNREQLNDIGGEATIISLLNAVPTSVNAESYGRLVESDYLRRKMIKAASEIANHAYDKTQSIERVVDRAEQALFSVTEEQTTRDLKPVKEVAREYLDRVQALHERGSEMIGVPTGFTDLDRIMSGLNRSDLLILAARPGMGKCVAVGTKVVDPQTGALVPIEDVVNRQQGRILTLNEAYLLEETEVSDFLYDGIKPVFYVETALGRQIKVTLSHPFLTIHGWCPLRELKVNDRIAVPRSLPVFGNDPVPAFQVKVLAYLLADGCLTDGSPRFTNSNKRLRDDFSEAALQFAGNKIRIETSNGARTPTIYVTKNGSDIGQDNSLFATRLTGILEQQKWTKSQLAKVLGVSDSSVRNWCCGECIPREVHFYQLCKVLKVDEYTLAPAGFATLSGMDNSLTVWLKEQGVWGKSALTKDIPSSVYRYTRNNVALFLNRLFACDGSIYLQSRNQPVVSYATASLPLARGVQHLLLRFGLIAKLRKRKMKYKGGCRISYQVRLTGSANVLEFIEQIGVFGKEEAVENVKGVCTESQRNTNTDTVPLEIWQDIRIAKGGRSWRRVYQKMGLPASHNIHVGKRAPSRQRLASIAVAIDAPHLSQLAQSDVYWDTITKIEYRGEQPVYDLTIAGTHNFVAEDIIVHNTAMQLAIARTAALQYGKRVAVFSLEMSAEQLVQRMIAAETRIDSQRLRRGNLHDNEWPIFLESIGRISESQIFIDDTPGVTPTQLRAKCRRLYAEYGIDLVLIDYLQLMQTERNTANRVQEISEISRGLKGLARELDVPVLAAAQLSRAVEQRQDKRPQLSDLRDSGSIEQDADIVMFIYRDEYYNPDTTEKPNIAEISIAKHRNGPTAIVDLYWHGKLATFRNLQRQELTL